MSPRYLFIVADHGLKVGIDPPFGERFGLRPVFRNRSLSAFANAGCPCVPVGDSGFVLGRAFPNSAGGADATSLIADHADEIAQSRGSGLCKLVWGGYVAAISGSAGVDVLRDPSGTFACYHGSLGDAEIFGSDAELLVGAGVSVSLDYEEIGKQLYRAFVPSPATALHGIRELLAGYVLKVPGSRGDGEPYWSPWEHVESRPMSIAEAAEELSLVVAACVDAWSATEARLLLSVSGGLDSSIIAACLAARRRDAVCLTMFTDDPSGDERAFARALCTHLGLPLIERPYRLEDIDITSPLGRHLPRPRDRTQANAYERVHLAVADEIGATAFMTGNGGDSVFGYSHSAAPITDRLIAEGFGLGSFETLVDVCRQTGCSIFDAARHAWRLWRGSPAHKVRPSPLFLHPEFVASLSTAEFHHPWLDAPRGALPGKAAHLSTILRVQPNLDASRGFRLPVLSPLMSQPIVEACLKVPTWRWRTGGRDRALARTAFADSLPATVLDRRVKGTPSRFAARLLDHYRTAIRDRLLQGRLADRRIVDAEALEHQLLGDRPIADLERIRILELVNIEAWLDYWASVSSDLPRTTPRDQIPDF